MGVLVDTSVLIGAARGRIDLEAHIRSREDEEFFLCVITASELLHGVHRALDANVRARRSAWVEGILSRFPMLQIDIPIARAHATIWAELSSQGNMIGPHDLWLAATCIAHGLTIVTENVREFVRVPGLNVETWSPRSA